MRQSIERYSYVWIIPGWYADRWWETGGDVILDDYRCSSTELAMFIVHQRVIAISHHPYIIMLNSTLSEDGVCVSSLDTSFYPYPVSVIKPENCVYLITVIVDRE